MNRFVVLIASVFIMLCIGGVYGWSIIAAELISNFGFTGTETQLIFGSLIAVFPSTMVLSGKYARTFHPRNLVQLAGVLFMSGYLIAAYSKGDFWPIFIGIGILGGISTGIAYWVSITLSPIWFPERRGLVTGIVAAGFGLGALLMTEISVVVLQNGGSVLLLLKVLGISYGSVMALASFFLEPAAIEYPTYRLSESPLGFIRTQSFFKLFLGIFLGTFAGLIIIGSLKIIGAFYQYSDKLLTFSVVLFAIANSGGRVFWGYFSDSWGAAKGVFFALLIQAVSIALLGTVDVSVIGFLGLVFFIGLGFGGNFVLFAKETAQEFGLNNLGVIYPYVFLGYAIAGIAGPVTGGYLFDVFDSYFYSLLLASIISLIGSMTFIHEAFWKKKAETH